MREFFNENKVIAGIFVFWVALLFNVIYLQLQFVTIIGIVAFILWSIYKAAHTKKETKYLVDVLKASILIDYRLIEEA
ncbi:MAG: hypothetical protein ACOCZ6_04770, partial [Nanoarchaeota archaeon]